MPGVQEFSQQVRSIIDVVIRFLRARKREEASISFGALLILAGVYLANGLEKVGLKEFFASWHGEDIVRGLLIAAGIGFVLFGAYKIFRLVYVPPPPIAKDRPSAIKGPMAFTEADGELFRKLGRESELQKLLGLALDDQVLMIVVRGASGAGKTSLLRAGLKHILGDRAIFHYWEAVPTEPDKGLLRALQEKWPEGATKPASLDELVNPAETLGRQSHVIVLDQFEQLRGSKKIFQLLTQIVRKSKPPHRITWVIAFRREFSADWQDFIEPEEARGFHFPQPLSLRLFTTEQATQIISQLLKDADLHQSINQAVVDNLVEAATVESEVSPVDIGIGLLVLAELHERQSGNTITIRDYQFAGGAEGLLTQYISRCLDLFPKENQEAILKAMLALRDAETNQRLAEGLPIDVLAKESGAEALALKTQLKRLADRDTRLLETVTPADGSDICYRLPHERLIPALYRLTGKLLAEVDQAKLKFQNAFQAWKTNDKRRAYLLKAKELKLVERFETQIPWGSDEQEKKGFLNRSKCHRLFVRAATVTAALAFIALGWASLHLYQRSEDIKYLANESGYPPELYDYQHQLKKLELMEPLNLERFNWLSSDSIEELSLKAASSSNSIAGLSSLSKCATLKKITLNFIGDVRLGSQREAQVSSLEPLSKLGLLQQLTLYGGSQVGNLDALSKLRNLQQLTLYSGNQENSLEPLLKLSNLQQLTLSLSESQVSNLESLSKLSNLQILTLEISNSQINNLELLSKLSNLHQLTLDLFVSQKSNLEPLSKLNNLPKLMLYLHEGQESSNLEPLSKLNNLQQLTLYSGSQAGNLEALGRLSNRTQLTLDLGGRVVSNLDALSMPSNLYQLKLNLSFSQLSNLESLSKLNNLHQLTLDLSFSQLNDLDVLAKLGNLQELTLSLTGSQGAKLESLSRLSNLQELTLYLNPSQESNLEPLSKLSHLQKLTLYGGSQVEYLDALSKLSNLQQLTLFLSGSQVSNLDALSKLSNLQQLTLSLSESQVSNLDALSKLSNLQQLTLDLSGSQVSNVDALSKLSDLTQLTLDLSGSQVSNLDALSKLPHLQSLSLETATRAQRMSLRKIPASLRELKF